MKRSIKFIIIMLCLLLLTGCVQYNAEMNIKKNKSMDFSIIYAVDESIFEKVKLLTTEEKNKIKKEGYEVENYKKGNMSGYKLKMNVNNIDKVSTKNNNVYNLNDIKTDKIFKVKKGIIKNRYKVNLKFDSSKNSLSESFNSKKGDTNNSKIDEQQWDEIISNTENLDLSFKVTLPYSAISNNATQSSNKDKELVWSLTSNEVSNIEFEFNLYNRITIIIIVAVILIILILIMSFYKNKKVQTENNDINKDIEKTDTDNNES